jgi:hypothetical protein
VSTQRGGTQGAAAAMRAALDAVGVGAAEGPRWKAHIRLEKRWGDNPDATPYEVIERDDNLLMYGGASALWQQLIGSGAITAYSNANAYIGVGDSTTAAAATQTDLQAATNKLRKAMDATYPLHTDGTTSGAASIVFRSTFATTDANFAWQEWAVFNASSTGRMLNRKVESLGTKTSSAAWTLTVTITLS